MQYQILSNLTSEYIENLKSRFWDKVDTSGECWEWTATLNSKGYGCIGVNGGNQLAHRVSYELHNGPVGKDLLVCHHCDNPSCVRPSHLFLGDTFANMQDAAEKGRLSPHKSKFSNALAIQIRNAFNPEVDKVTLLAEQYKVSPDTMRSILRGDSYKKAGGKTYKFTNKQIPDHVFNDVKELAQMGVSYSEIAQRLNIGIGSVSRIMNGKQRVN